MITLRFPVALALVALLAGCRSGPDATVTLPAGGAATPAERGDEPPVALNANSPVVYPAALIRERIEGTVLLRLYLDSTGSIVRESTLVAESSGYVAFDSAALSAVPRLRFAPALRRGEPVATAFLQPIHFRNPGRAGLP